MLIRGVMSKKKRKNSTVTCELTQMDVDNVSICRFCLETCKSGCKMDLEISYEPVVCKDCVGNFKECFSFKIGYLNKIGCKFPEIEDVEGSIPRVHRIENATAALKTSNSNTTCCICMELISCETSVLLKDEANIVSVMEKYFPEQVLNGTMDSMCIACYKSLQNQWDFISTCLAVEEKIKEYCKVVGTDNRGQVDLGSVLYFMSKNELQNNIHSNFGAVKLEDSREEIENEDIVKIKNEDLIEMEEPGIYYDEKDGIDTKMESDEGIRFDALDSTDEKCPKPFLPTEKNTNKVLFSCEVCTYQSKRRPDLARHMLTHIHSSDVTVFKCETCTFETKHKTSLQRHVLIHKNTSEVTMSKCKICTYQSRYKCTLSRHMLTHKSTAEVMVYKCGICTYQSTRKSNFSDHILSHKDPSEVMYKCKTCKYQNRHKDNFLDHLSSHKDPLYKCQICTYQSTRKNNITSHMLTHKDPSQVKMYECELCTYQSKRKGNLSMHMLTHKDSPEITTYKCEICTFVTKYKASIRQHALIHKPTYGGSIYKNVRTEQA